MWYAHCCRADASGTFTGAGVSRSRQPRRQTKSVKSEGNAGWIRRVIENGRDRRIFDRKRLHIFGNEFRLSERQGFSGQELFLTTEATEDTE